MKTNFEIEGNYAVRLNGVHIDLHNNFDFVELSKSENNISVYFRQTEGDWVKNDEFKILSFEFKDISYVYYEGEAPDEDTKTLVELTFFPANSREINDEIISQILPNDSDDLIMFFEDRKVIRIGCEEIKLITEK